MKRATIAAPAEDQPFRATPLTPIGWDVEAAQASGAQHPSNQQGGAPAGGKQNAVLKNAITKFKPLNQWQLKKAAAKAKAKGKAKGGQKGRGKGQGNVKLASGIEVDPRVVTISPGKGRRRGKGKQK